MKSLKTKLKYSYLGLALGLFLIISHSSRGVFLENIFKALPGREAALLGGMIWGEKGLLDKFSYKQMVNSGLIHIIVVSGANLMILGRLFIEKGAEWLGRKEAIVVGLAVMAGYINLVGWQIPVVRAGLFLLYFYGAQLLGKKFYPLRATVILMLIMIVSNYKIIYEVSFWLSMVAFVGILTSRGKGVVKSSLWIGWLLVPISSWYFGKINWLSPLSNSLVFFVIQFLTVVGMVGSVAGSSFILKMTYSGLRYILEVAERGGGGWGSLEIKFNGAMMAGFYLLSFWIYERYFKK